MALKLPSNPQQQDVFNKQLVKLEQELKDKITIFEDKIAALEELQLPPRTAAIEWTGSQSTVAGGSHVEFDQAGGALVDAGLISLSTGTGQAKGIISLAVGHAYRIEAYVYADTVNGGHRTMRLRHNDGSDLTDITRGGTRALQLSTADSDLADVRRSQGTVSVAETSKLTVASDVVFDFVTGYGVLLDAWMLITEVAP